MSHNLYKWIITKKPLLFLNIGFFVSVIPLIYNRINQKTTPLFNQRLTWFNLCLPLFNQQKIAC